MHRHGASTVDCGPYDVATPVARQFFVYGFLNNKQNFHYHVLTFPLYVR